MIIYLQQAPQVLEVHQSAYPDEKKDKKVAKGNN